MSQGIARRLFIERGYGGEEDGIEDSFSLIDRALAGRLMGVEGDEFIGAFLSYLSSCSRQGHLCVRWDGDGLHPIFGDDHDRVVEGVKRVLEREDLWEQLSLRIFRSDVLSLIYFEKYWCYETIVWDHYQRLMGSEPSIVVDEGVEKKDLYPEQVEAIREVCGKCLTFICGGPGTGKSYLVKYLIRLLPDGCRVAVAAPTGKAASRLEGFVDGFCGTLHKLLEVNISGGRSRGAARYLDYDLIVVDESSMVDVNMMGHLLSSVKPGARLVLMGDPDQLPSVEAGSVFHDLVKISQEGVVELSRCMRVDTQSLVELASAVKHGEAMDRLREGQHWKTFGEVENLVKRVVEAFSCRESFRVLCPLRRGLWGVNRINALCSSAGRLKREPIMITRTDDFVGLVNGETGFLVSDEGDEEYAVFSEGEGEKRMPARLLPPYEYAYCLSVHKSQGSEYDHVVLLLPEGSEVFGWQLFYTAITRAKKSLEVWSSEETLERVLSQSFVRVSGLMERE